jgi:hypothetical protein
VLDNNKLKPIYIFTGGSNKNKNKKENKMIIKTFNEV